MPLDEAALEHVCDEIIVVIGAAIREAERRIDP